MHRDGQVLVGVLELRVVSHVLEEVLGVEEARVVHHAHGYAGDALVAVRGTEHLHVV